MIEDGTLDGLRLDHIDGLLDPKRYLDGLRAACSRPFYLVIEKILAAHEQLREDWPIEGHNRLRFHQPRPRRDDQPGGRGELHRHLPALHRPRPRRSTKIVRDCKIRIMDNEMASELMRSAATPVASLARTR